MLADARGASESTCGDEGAEGLYGVTLFRVRRQFGVAEIVAREELRVGKDVFRVVDGEEEDTAGEGLFGEADLRFGQEEALEGRRHLFHEFGA